MEVLKGTHTIIFSTCVNFSFIGKKRGKYESRNIGTLPLRSLRWKPGTYYGNYNEDLLHEMLKTNLLIFIILNNFITSV